MESSPLPVFKIKKSLAQGEVSSKLNGGKDRRRAELGRRPSDFYDYSRRLVEKSGNNLDNLKNQICDKDHSPLASLKTQSQSSRSLLFDKDSAITPVKVSLISELPPPLHLERHTSTPAELPSFSRNKEISS